MSLAQRKLNGNGMATERNGEGHTSSSIHSSTSYQATLNKLVWVTAKNLSILATTSSEHGSSVRGSLLSRSDKGRGGTNSPGSRFTLVGIDDEVSRSLVSLGIDFLLPSRLVHERPVPPKIEKTTSISESPVPQSLGTESEWERTTSIQRGIPLLLDLANPTL